MNPGAFSLYRWVSRGVGILAGCGWAIVPLQAEPLTGGSYAVVAAIASGGGASSGGAFMVNGWVATAGAGTSQGQDFALTCGLVGGYVIAGGDVPLKVALVPGGQARLWWPAGVGGYQLEYSLSLSPGAAWRPVSPTPADNSVIVPAAGLTRFFRLRK